MAEDRRQIDAYERVYLGMAVAVTAVWIIATLVQVALPDRIVPTYANLVMMTVAGSFFGGAVISSRRRANGNGKTPPPALPAREEDPYDGPGGYFRA